MEERQKTTASSLRSTRRALHSRVWSGIRAGAPPTRLTFCASALHPQVKRLQSLMVCKSEAYRPR